MKKILKIFVNFFYGFPISIILIIIRPLILIRFQQISSERIGFLAAATELYLCEKKFKINHPSYKNYIDIFCYQKIISNQYLAKIWKRKILILPYFLVTPIQNCLKLLDKNKIHQLGNNKSGDRDVFNLIEKTKPFLSLSDQDIKKGYALLSKFNVDKNSKIICVVIRDDNYLEKVFNKNFSRHDYRNFKIESFYPTFKECVKRGYFVFIMGKYVKQKLSIKNEMIIDYANSDIRSDFLDIFIGSICKLSIRTSGYGAIPFIFRKPSIEICPSLGEMYTFNKHDLLLIKDHYDLKAKKILSFHEIFSRNLAFNITQKKLLEENVELRENEKDIKNALIEQLDRIENKTVNSSYKEVLQKQFWDAFNKKISFLEYRHLHGKKYSSRFSSDYLKKPNWF